MSTYTPNSLYINTPSATAETALTLRPFSQTLVPTGNKVVIKQIVMSNVTGADAVIGISHVPAGSTGGNSTRIVPNITVPKNQSVTYELSEVLETGDFLSGLQGTANAIVVSINGYVIAG